MAWCLAVNAAAQEGDRAPMKVVDHEDHAMVLELGAAGDWSRAEGAHGGGTVAIEVTPIDRWLELEIGVTAIRAKESAEIPIDVLCKKPWRLSPRVELMVGVGPEIVHVTGRESATFWGLESVVDLMFWSRKNVGWYVEPGYAVTFPSGGRHQGLGIAVGLLLGR